MQPEPGDSFIEVPVTFGYKGGRSSNRKNKIIAGIVIMAITIIVTIGIVTNGNLELWKRIIFGAGIFYLGLLLMRFLIFNELKYSDIYETLKAKDYKLDTTDIWNIFDIDSTYPYICYFKNGLKGIFVRMEKGAITGKAEDADYYHFDAISEAYNKAYSRNMDIVYIDYMDNVGNDPRLAEMYRNLADVENPDMQNVLQRMYDHLAFEMSNNYSSFDIYLFLTREKADHFRYDMQTVVNTMLGGNYITYKVLDKVAISNMCMILFNMHDFSLTDACENVLAKERSGGIVPIKVEHGDGTIEKINKTREERRIEREAAQRRARDAQIEKEEEKKRRKNQKKGVVDNSEKELDTELDIFSDEEHNDIAKSNDINKSQDIGNKEKSESDLDGNVDEVFDLFEDSEYDVFENKNE